MQEFFDLRRAFSSQVEFENDVKADINASQEGIGYHDGSRESPTESEEGAQDLLAFN